MTTADAYRAAQMRFPPMTMNCSWIEQGQRLCGCIQSSPRRIEQRPCSIGWPSQSRSCMADGSLAPCFGASSFCLHRNRLCKLPSPSMQGGSRAVALARATLIIVEVSSLPGSPRNRRCCDVLLGSLTAAATKLPAWPRTSHDDDDAGRGNAAACPRYQAPACLVPMDVSDMSWSTRRREVRVLLRSAKHANSN